jgi:nitronate monooxygenase
MSLERSAHLLELLDIQWPIIQAPMAGTSTPALAAAVSNAGGLGSLGIGATNAEGARKMIAEFQALSARSLNVNVFCHQPAKLDAKIESAWIDRLRPEFARFGATPPTQLAEIYRSFVEDDDMLAALIQEKPKVVSFHFGVPAPERVRALRDAGIILMLRPRTPRRRKPSPMLASTQSSPKAMKLAVTEVYSIRMRRTVVSGRSPLPGFWRGSSSFR